MHLLDSLLKNRKFENLANVGENNYRQLTSEIFHIHRISPHVLMLFFKLFNMVIDLFDLFFIDTIFASCPSHMMLMLAFIFIDF